MRKLLYALCLGTLLSLLVFQASYAQSDQGNVPPQMSPADEDSLRSAKEPTLQNILDGLGYDIDVVNDRLPTEVWAVIAGQQTQVMLAEVAEYSDQTVSGWYCAGSPSDTHHVFGGANAPDDSAHFYVTGCDFNGLFIAPFAGGGKCYYRYYTQSYLNPDHKDHAWVYCSGQKPNEFIVAWEDRYNLGDADFQDLVLLYRLPNRPPVLSVPDDRSYDLCSPRTVCFGPITARDQDYCDSVELRKIQGPGTLQGNSCCFMPGAATATYEFVFVATDLAGAADTEEVRITVNLNQPPQITCPPDDSVKAGNKFISGNFSVSDPKCWPKVRLCGIDPSATYQPYIRDRHVEWQTTCAEAGKTFTICLEVEDECGAKDTCYFDVKVYNYPPQITCPPDDSVKAGNKFISGNFSVSDPKCWPRVRLCGIDPSATHQPVIVERHIEWQTTCAEAGKIFTICLEAEDECGAKDTCYFDVTVYNEPPDLTCPDDDSVKAGQSFTSTDYSVGDPDDDPADLTVTLDGVSPTPTNTPVLVNKHVEWLTAQDDLTNGPVFTFTLIAVDPCGAADTCEFSVTVYRPVVLIVPEDDSVHAGNYFTSEDFSVSGGGKTITVSICGITPTPVHQPTIVESHVEWQTECADDGKIFTICLEAADQFGAKDTGYFDVTVYNRPPQLTCPDDGVVHALQNFVSTDFAVTDPDADPAPVTFLDVTPSAANHPQVVDQHVEWMTTLSEYGDYTIRLVATDPCGLADTCDFSVFVDEPTGEFGCPEDDSVHAGDFFVSTDFTLTYPECNPSSVEILDIVPAVTNSPIMMGYHVEWQTTCEEDGDYVITLITGEQCSVPDTCSFIVTVYNRPPELICPDYGHVIPMGLFVSTDFRFSDPDGDNVSVALLGIDPPAEHDPVIVQKHVEWQTVCLEGDYVITLVATDPCGLADTCEFMVTVSLDPPPDFYIWVWPTTQEVSAGNSAGYLVELNSILGYHWPCSLYVSGLPVPPNSADFDQPVITPTGFTTMTVYTAPQTDSGTYVLTVIGKEIGRPVAHSIQVNLKVKDTLDPLDADDDTDAPGLPQSFSLFQNQPNPFNPETQISYHLSKDCQVSLTIYNVLGQKVNCLFQGYQAEGKHTLTWDGRSDQGEQLSSGIYFYRLQAGDFQETKKMTLMK